MKAELSLNSVPKMANRERCFLHSGKRSHEQEGFFEDFGIGPKWCCVRLFYCDVEYTARIKREKVHAQQRGLDLRNRYFAISERGVVHVCTCRYTKAFLDHAKVEAERLFSGIRVE